MKNILIVGEYNVFINEIINMFHREKWHVSVLTNKKGAVKREHVFEQYIFDYNNESVRDILNSAKLDVLIFSGAFDSSFDWKNRSSQAANDYISGLNNILNHAGFIGIKTILYLSSEGIFENEYMLDITEDFIPHPQEIKNSTLWQGENMVRNLGLMTGLETIVVRIAGMYGIPQDGNRGHSLFVDTCLEALKKGKIEVNNKKTFSAIYIRDIIEALFILINAPLKKHNLYHISSMDEMTEMEIALIIQANFPYPIEIVDKTIGVSRRIILSNKRFQEEFPLEIRNKPEKIIPQIIEFIIQNKKLFLDIQENSRKQAFIKWAKLFIPFFEAIFVFAFVFYLSVRKEEYSFLSGLDLYILYTLVFAIVYGRQQAIFTSFLCVIGKTYYTFILSDVFSPGLQQQLYFELVQIFLVSLPVGHLRDVFREMKNEKGKTIDLLEDKLKDITSINEINSFIKNYYADKILSNKESIGRLYGITTKLHNAGLGEVQFAVIDVLQEILETKDASIYFVSDKGFCRLASASSELSKSLGKTIQLNEYKDLYDDLMGKNIFINRSFDTKLPAMAGALFDESEHLRVVLLIWNLPFHRMTLDNANLLSIIGTLFYSYFVKESKYLNALSFQRYIKDTKILQKDSFDEVFDLYRKAEKRGYAQSSLLYVEGKGNRIDESNKLYHLIRETDYIGQTEDGNYKILLTNTNNDEVIYVKNRLKNNHFVVFD